jgi:hypothetical protein
LLQEEVDHNGERLTFDGWRHYDELQRSQTEGAVAFMAMPFGNPELDRLYSEHFRPAVTQTGFDLRRVDEAPPAGLIDARMEVEIRRSSFLVAELTNENRGVYWEAGFAEGLGRPVIYTCERSYYENHSGTHFDTSHRHTIIWSRDDLNRALLELKNTVRATLPEVAKLDDN